MNVQSFFHHQKTKYIIIAFVFLAVISTVALGIQGRKAPPPVKEEKTVTVKTIQIYPRASDVYLNYVGLIQPQTLEQAMAATIGEIQKIYVKEGDVVKKGQVLFTLDDSTAKQQQNTAYQSMKAAQAAMNSAKTTQEAAKKAYDGAEKAATEEEKTAAKQELQQAIQTRDALQAQLDAINQQLQPQKDEVAAAQTDLDAKQKIYDEAKAKAEAENATQQDKEALQKAQEDLDLAKETLAQKQAQLIKSQEELNFAQTQNQLAQAQDQVAAKQQQLEKLENSKDAPNLQILKTQMETANYSFESAQATYEATKSNYDAATKQVDKCTYRAQMDGFVVKIISTSGSMATPFIPVLVVGSHNMVAQFGVSQTDVRQVTVGQEAIVTINGINYQGKVKDVAVTPNTETRTYITNVDIYKAPKDLYLGETATVQLSLGQKDGVWLPISVIMSDGQDYVYVIEDGRATRKPIEIEDMNNDLVRVSGLENGGLVISEGMKTVKSGNLVQIMEEN